eukprot:PITA_20396
MDVLRESRYIISSFTIIIVCWLGWLCGLVFGQVAEAFTSAVNFPDVGLTCLANLAAFFTFILRGKHFYESFAENDVVLKMNVEERNINGLEVTTTCGENLKKCSVVMLSFHYPATLGPRKFMNSISNVSDVHSIFLRCRPLQCGAFTEDFPKCSCTENRDGRCGCIVFNTVQDITMMLARQLPGTLKMKRLSDSQCLLPCGRCLSKGCHGCNQGLLHAENDTLKEGDPNLESPAAVCEILESIPKVGACICIPVRPFNEDEWTNELIRVFVPQKGEFRGVVFREGGTNASSALENYKNGNGECDADETYSLASLAILPYLAEALIMFVLTFFLKVDGFSSAVLAKRAVSSYGSSIFFPISKIFPHKHLTRARVKSNANNTNVCQVFFFRPAFQISILHSLFGYSACICCIGWTVLVAKEGRADQWYHIPSMAPSEGRIKLLYIVVCIAIGRVVGIKAFGRWIYSALQCLDGYIVLCNASGVILNNCQHAVNQDSLEDGQPMWWYGTCGHYIRASAFLLNASLAGVRAQWKFS